MTPANKDELLAALADSDLQIKQAAARMIGHVTDEEWRAALDIIIELRELRLELELKLGRLGAK